MFSNFRRRASTLSLEESELNNSGGEGSGFPPSGGGGSSSLSAVSPRRAASRALAASSSLSRPTLSVENVANVVGGGAPSSTPETTTSTPTAAAFFSRVAAPFRSKTSPGPSRRSSDEDGGGGSLKRGESGLALLDNERGGTKTSTAAAAAVVVVSPFEVEGPRPSPRPTSAASPSSSDSRSYEASIMRKVDRAILPCFMALTLVNYLDRTNLAYASTQMANDVGLTPAQYGLGSSIFFVSYVGMQLPLVALGCRVGRVPFLALSCVAWGVSAAAFAGVRTVSSFYFLRLLLGASEAATFPIMWAHVRAFYAHDDAALGHAYSYVTAVIAAAQIVGGPLAALLLRLDGMILGLKGWQVLFLFEAAPTLAVAAWVLRLPRSPETATRCLDPEERRWLSTRIRAAVCRDHGVGGSAASHISSDSSSSSVNGGSVAERSVVGGGTSGANNASSSSFAAVFSAARSALSSPWIWVLGGIEALVAAAKYAIIYFLPLLVSAMVTGGGKSEGFGKSDGAGDASSSSSLLHEHHAPPPPASAAAAVAALSAVPFGLAAVATMANAAHSKRTGERRWHVVWPVSCCAAGLAALGLALRHKTTLASNATASAAAAAAAPAFASLVVASLVFAAAGVVSSYPSSIIKRSMASNPARAKTATAASTKPTGNVSSSAPSSSTFADDAAAALGYGLANALGNLGGLVGPAAFGAARAKTGGYSSACAMLSAFAAVAAVLYAVILPHVSPEGEVTGIGISGRKSRGGRGGSGGGSVGGGGGRGSRAAAVETPTSM